MFILLIRDLDEITIPPLEVFDMVHITEKSIHIKYLNQVINFEEYMNERIFYVLNFINV